MNDIIIHDVVPLVPLPKGSDRLHPRFDCNGLVDTEKKMAKQSTRTVKNGQKSI
jgi:hypothetical protein